MRLQPQGDVAENEGFRDSARRRIGLLIFLLRVILPGPAREMMAETAEMSEMAQDGSGWFKDGPRWVVKAPEMTEDG